MALVKKSELDSMSDAQKSAKIAELERAMLELIGEGKREKVKAVRKTIARLKTPRPIKSAAKK